jgi:mycofactocin system FadH/OYE family oxidoreductase 2
VTVYPHLFRELRLGGVSLRNRIVLTAHITHYAQDGIDSQRDVDYYAARARGGVGLIILGNRLVHPTSSQVAPRFPWGYLPEWIPSQRRLVEAVHTYGTAVFAQLNHFGINGSSDAVDDLRVLWGPSAVRSPANGELPKVMEREDIGELVEWWGRSAEYMREAGFDGVEVHLAHSYLLHQFLSPIWNKREDEYGGTFDNRLRIAREVIDEVRHRVGEDYVVGIRIALSEFTDGGLDVEDAARTASALERACGIDYVNVTAGGYHNLFWAPAPSDIPDGWLVGPTARVKRELQSAPIVAVGGLKDAAQAEAVLAAGHADLVALTRAHIADPEFVAKVRSGREDEIVHCIRCNQACIGRLFKGTPVGCTVNPVTGRERKFGRLPPAAQGRRWLVVGGGPAGMKTAVTLAQRGHAVTLTERQERLGGQVNLILRTPGRETFAWLVRDLEAQLAKAGVDVRLRTPGTLELVRELAPEGVVVATGAQPSRTGYSTFAPLVDQLPGCEEPGVLTSWDVLLERRPVGERVVVLDDDGARGAAGTVEVLLDRGKRVEVVTPWSSLFPFTAPTMEQPILYERLFGKGLTFRANSWARSFSGGELTIFNLYCGAEEIVRPVDTLVLATAPVADDALYLELKATGATIHRVGDCVAPRRLDHAIYEGYLAGRELWSPDERYILEGELERRAADAPAIPVGADGAP